jgi:hypothetical protein
MEKSEAKSNPKEKIRQEVDEDLLKDDKAARNKPDSLSNS